MSASKLFSKTTLMTLLISGGISWAQAADTVQMTMTGIIQAPAASASGAQTGVVIEGTRVIYQPGQKEHSLTVRNQSKERWLIESWVDSDAVTGTTDSASTPPFEVSPALFRLDP
ncbi:fimbrial biogenesis chaperone, partial [Cronobacter sakazakii]|uniref:fimbrial biogenesis chaperone n=2 Tax=Enterobacteriaceae TaxID=543 RepID=UPI00158BAE19